MVKGSEQKRVYEADKMEKITKKNNQDKRKTNLDTYKMKEIIKLLYIDLFGKNICHHW